MIWVVCRQRTCPAAPPEGWCSIILLLGSDRRWPASPAARSKDAMEHAWPTAKVATGHLMYCIVSYMANPAVTTPPGELMYMLSCGGQVGRW